MAEILSQCPTCGHKVTVYERKLYGRQIKTLKVLREAGSVEYHHLPSLQPNKDGGDPAKLRFWDLIEQMPGKRIDGGQPGWWRITQKGRIFLDGVLAVPASVFIADNKVVRWSERMVRVQEATDGIFDLREART